MASWNKEGLVTWRRGLVWWKAGDALYQSIPFTWLLSAAETMAKAHNGPVYAGGPAVALKGAPWAETPYYCGYDTLSMHNPLATFTTRGCPNRCGFCAVPKIEGDFVQLPCWKPAPIICDNNLLASTKRHFKSVIDSLAHFPEVDFNQGLDARRFTSWHAHQIARLKRPMIRFAFDHVNQEATVADAIKTARDAGLRRFHVYVLIGYNDTPDDAFHRLETVRSWGIRPNPMRYQPLDADEKNAHVGPGWTSGLLFDVVRYYSKLRWLEHIPFEQYHRYGEMPLIEMTKER